MLEARDITGWDIIRRSRRGWEGRSAGRLVGKQGEYALTTDRRRSGCWRGAGFLRNPPTRPEMRLQ
jgi:hypothetical protein